MLEFSLALALVQNQPLPKIAEITAATGSVEIVGPKGAARKPARFGSRWKNAEVRDEDRIKTGPGAQAVILFPDASKFTVKEKSEIQILQKALPKPTAQGNTVGRRIKVLLGELVSDIAPSEDVNTVFESPAGCASVRGTRLTLRADDASLTLSVRDGLVRFFDSEHATRFDVTRDQRIRAVRGSLVFEIQEDAGRSVQGRIGSKDVEATQGDRFKVVDRGDSVSVEIQTGPLKVDGKEGSDNFETHKGTGVNDENGGFDPAGGTAGGLPEGPEGPQDEGSSDLKTPGNDGLDDKTSDVASSTIGGASNFEGTIGEEWIQLSWILGESRFHAMKDPLFITDPMQFHLSHAINGVFQGVSLAIIPNQGLGGYFGFLDSYSNELWHAANDGSPDAAGRYEAFFKARTDFLGAAGLVADQVAAGAPPKFHDFWHAKLEDQHVRWHIDNDSLADPWFTNTHAEFHSYRAEIHDALHAMPPHDFLHFQIDLAHKTWHDEMLLSEACFDFDTPGLCKDAHDLFHHLLDKAHGLNHSIFGF